jgi:MoaA/NifB/PqqE/SkfB family radical SAM enzyme
VTSLGPLARRLVDQVKRERIPFAGGIELTHRCNLACVHCYVNLPAADREAKRREMSLAELERVLDELADLGTVKLTFTGGEPLVRSDFAEIYRHAHRKGFVLAVYTNATLITRRIADLWREHPPAYIEITQYGFSSDVYDRVVDAGAGQHERFARGVDLLLAAGVRVSMKSVALRRNAHEIEAMASWARGRGMPFRFDAIISPRIDGGRGPLSERLSPAEVARLEASSVPSTAFADYCASRVGAAPSDDSLYQCGAGLGTFLIDPYGRLHVCELSRRPGWDVVTHGFTRGWYEEIPRLREARRASGAACGSCAGHDLCSNCVGMAELEGLPLEDGHPYLCEVTDERARHGGAAVQPAGLVNIRLGSTKRSAA